MGKVNRVGSPSLLEGSCPAPLWMLDTAGPRAPPAAALHGAEGVPGALQTHSPSWVPEDPHFAPPWQAGPAPPEGWGAPDSNSALTLFCFHSSRVLSQYFIKDILLTAVLEKVRVAVGHGHPEVQRLASA